MFLFHFRNTSYFPFKLLNTAVTVSFCFRLRLGALKDRECYHSSGQIPASYRICISYSFGDKKGMCMCYGDISNKSDSQSVYLRRTVVCQLMCARWWQKKNMSFRYRRRKDHPLSWFTSRLEIQKGLDIRYVWTTLWWTFLLITLPNSYYISLRKDYRGKQGLERRANILTPIKLQSKSWTWTQVVLESKVPQFDIPLSSMIKFMKPTKG